MSIKMNFQNKDFFEKSAKNDVFVKYFISFIWLVLLSEIIFCGCWLVMQWLQIETWKKWGFYYGKLKLQMKWSNGMATKLTLTEKNIN